MNENTHIKTFEESIFDHLRKQIILCNYICAFFYFLLSFADPDQFKKEFLIIRLLTIVSLIINALLLKFLKFIKPFTSVFLFLIFSSIFLYYSPILLFSFKTNLLPAYIVGFYIAVLCINLVILITQTMLNTLLIMLLITISIFIGFHHDIVNSVNIRIIVHFYSMTIIAYIFGRVFNAKRVKEFKYINTINKQIKQYEESEKTLKKEIRARKKVEKELIEYQEILKSKNQAILEFSNMVTHDLKKPLTGISSVFQILENEKEFVSSSSIAEVLTLGKQATLYMEELLEDLLDNAKWDTGKHQLDKENVDIQSIVDDVINQLTIFINDKSIMITSNVKGILFADKKALVKVFMNILGNAVNYIGERENKSIMIDSTFNQEKNEYSICIKDNGIGIPENSKEHIFKKFKRGENTSNYSGTGLGLPIVKSIIEAHNGKIWFESKEGEGTTFYFILPAGNIDEPVVFNQS